MEETSLPGNKSRGVLRPRNQGQKPRRLSACSLEILPRLTVKAAQ